MGTGFCKKNERGGKERIKEIKSKFDQKGGEKEQ